MKNKITIVCCYNDRKQYERLQASLAKQNTGYELIGMDNCHGQYASCSLALNAATARVETEYVIYAHQDVELPKEDTLARFAGYLAQTGEADLLGVAGIVPGAIPGRKKYFGEAEGIVLSGVQHGEGELAAAGEQAHDAKRADAYLLPIFHPDVPPSEFGRGRSAPRSFMVYSLPVRSFFRPAQSLRRSFLGKVARL